MGGRESESEERHGGHFFFIKELIQQCEISLVLELQTKGNKAFHAILFSMWAFN